VYKLQQTNTKQTSRSSLSILSYRDEVAFSERDVARVMSVAVVLHSSRAHVRTRVWTQTNSCS